MTAAAALREPGPDGGAVAARLAALTDPVFLAEAGWDPGTRVLSLPSAHPLLGWRACPSPGCGNLLYGRDRECGSCRRGTTARRLASPGAAALAAQPCGVAACPRGRGRRRYCRAHWERFLDLRGDASFDEEAWQETEPAIEEPGQVSLHGLTERAAAEVLFGLQQRTRCGTTTDSVRLRQVTWELRRAGSAAISQITGGGQTQHRLARSLARHADRAMLAPEAEARKDVWDLAAFGLPGRLDFTRLRQRWLRESARRWAADNLPRRRGKIAAGPVRHYLTSLATLSVSLHASRDDHGADPAALGRPDIESFAHRMAFLAATEKISGDARTRACREVRHLLREFRALGLTRHGGPAGGLPDDFAVRGSGIPLKPDDPEAGRDLPPEIMRQLCDRLPDLERASCRETRAAAELMIDTGRRPDEVCALPWDCLEYDEPGREPVLVYFNHKSARDGRRLPVAQATAGLILAQKARVREMFPGAPLGELRLLPAAYANPHGRRPVTENHFGACHREWVDAMPPLLRADGTEFDKARVVPYAYRHLRPAAR